MNSIEDQIKNSLKGDAEEFEISKDGKLVPKGSGSGSISLPKDLTFY
jgi:hypothetical protein